MASEKKSCIAEQLEKVDAQLLALDKTLAVTEMGASSMANGDYIEGLLSCIRCNLQSIRADLDEATGTAIIAHAIA